MVLVKAGCFSMRCCHGYEGEGIFFINFSWVSPYQACYMKNCFPTQLLDMIFYFINKQKTPAAGKAFHFIRSHDRGCTFRIGIDAC